MTTQRFLIALSLVNFAFLLLMPLGAIAPRATAETDEILRGRGLQIVDGEGRVRASLSVLPPTEGQTETVLLRLINRDGQPSVKIGTSESGGGLSLVGGDDASYVVLQAEGPESSLKLVGPDGRQQMITP